MECEHGSPLAVIELSVHAAQTYTLRFLRRNLAGQADEWLAYGFDRYAFGVTPMTRRKVW